MAAIAPLALLPWFRQQYHALHVIGMGKHVDRLDAVEPVALAYQLPHIAHLRFGVTRNIDDASGCHKRRSIDEFNARTGARRIQKQHVSSRSSSVWISGGADSISARSSVGSRICADLRNRRCALAHEFTCVPYYEFGVLDAVVPCVLTRIDDGRLHAVNADHVHVFRNSSGNQPDGARTAIRIDYCERASGIADDGISSTGASSTLGGTDACDGSITSSRAQRFVQTSHLYGATVQHLGLRGVYLVKRVRRYAKA